MTEVREQCLCNGIRFCACCINSERVRKLFTNEVELRDASSVIEKQFQNERTSSYSFAITKSSQYALCIQCGKIFSASKPIRCCQEHDKVEEVNIETFRGAFVVPNFLSGEEECEIINFLDSDVDYDSRWQVSQSGRRKQEYGPTKNFKKKKVKVGNFLAMPKAFERLFTRVNLQVQELTRRPYIIAEASALEYVEEKLSNIDLHVDDTWLWGERIAGINLLSDCSMTFMDANEICIEVHLPRRCFFLMSGDCRYKWMHGIRPESVTGRRISITLRELSDEVASNDDLRTAILSSAQRFEELEKDNNELSS